MRAYIFAEKSALTRTGCDETEIVRIMDDLAVDTDTTDLVVALYLFSRQTVWEAHATGEQIGREKFTPGRGFWRFATHFGTPEDLPDRFYLVRIALGLRTRYPATETDCYGWEMTFEAFRDHLAYTFAHELHHFRRDNHGLHHREGEHSAVRWALDRVRRAGYYVSGLRLPVRKRRRPKRRVLRLPSELRPDLLRRLKLSASHLCAADLRELDRWIRRRLAAVARQGREGRLEAHYAMLKGLPAGTAMRIRKDDDDDGYAGQIAVKVRNLKRGSPRMLVRTADGQEWHWPMEWLEPAPADHTGPQQTLFPENA